jgi:hypothetical protein
MKLHPFPILLGLLGLLAILVIGIGYNAATAPLPDDFPQPTPDGKIEVKSYPAYRSGTYGYSGPLRQAAEVAFEPLYRHISSNNIGMTAPVETRYPMLTLQEGLRAIPVNEFGFYLSNPLGGLILGFFRMVDVGRYFGKWVVWGNNCRLDLKLVSLVQSGFLDLG